MGSTSAGLEFEPTEARMSAQRELEALKASKALMESELQAAENKRRAAELEKEEARKRAERAEAELCSQKRPLPSRRTECLDKRRRLEHDPRLSGFDGSLHDRINQARDAGKITAHEASTMHKTRMTGNKAAHEPTGFFGTQADLDEGFPDSDD